MTDVVDRAQGLKELVDNLDSIVDKNYLTHGIHPYPAKFVPQIPGRIIDLYSEKGDVVLDPFCGSGTSLLESLVRCRKAIGIDINPIATLISRVKTTPLESRDRDSILSLLNNIETNLFSRDVRMESERQLATVPLKNLNHWFQRNVQLELSRIRYEIDSSGADEPALDFMNLCLSAIIVRVSNQSSETRWVAARKDIADGWTTKEFINRTRVNLSKVDELALVCGASLNHTTVFTMDTRDCLRNIESASIGLVVSSPPYPNSFDYYLYHKLRMAWLGYDHKSVQASEIGSRNKHSDNGDTVESFAAIMTNVFLELGRVLRQNGKCVFVVGDSIVRGRLYKMDEIYAEIAQQASLALERMESFDQRRYTRAFHRGFRREDKMSHILVFGHQT